MFGMAGFCDWSLTLRELVFAVEGRNKSAWARTSLLACILANANRDPKKQRRPFTPDDFNPYADGQARRGTPLTVGTLHLLATAITSASK